MEISTGRLGRTTGTCVKRSDQHKLNTAYVVPCCQLLSEACQPVLARDTTVLGGCPNPYSKNHLGCSTLDAMHNHAQRNKLPTEQQS